MNIVQHSATLFSRLNLVSLKISVIQPSHACATCFLSDASVASTVHIFPNLNHLLTVLHSNLSKVYICAGGISKPTGSSMIFSLAKKSQRYGRYGARACSQRFSAKDSSTALNSSKGSPQWGTGCAWQSASRWNADSTCLNSTGGSFNRFNTPLLHFIIRNSCRILQIWSLAFDIFALAKIYGIK